MKVVEVDEEFRDNKQYLPQLKKIKGLSTITFQSTNKIDNNHAISYYMQWGALNPFHQSILALLMKNLRTMAFEYLRTEKQLGYNVNVQEMTENNVMGLAINIIGVAKDVDTY